MTLTNVTNHAKSQQRPNCIGIQQYLLLCILMHAIVRKPNPQFINCIGLYIGLAFHDKQT